MASKNFDSVYKREDLNWVTHTHCFIRTKKNTMERLGLCQIMYRERETLSWIERVAAHQTQIKLSKDAVLVKCESRFCHCISHFLYKMFSETYFKPP